ncbi:4-hydroxybenzoate 3-monooxygenase [Paraburkholderia acidicola]|uniref:4-hydroxybenzoate 3-monooxygenase n=1 Tax=Paraburkholderia acidicola TaxID=1912599 RepID=A0A2A4EYI4_9BURK|nr:4-hydroxybenzoate 3-monooxygenase [Paraburkholderia acidicola]PCE25925.1 4-hydroxybenzoate 3-monooxygenase [Paraburkholderia acidicola]
MEANREETSVVIIGAGVSGLTLATFLQSARVNCVVLERRDRATIEVRQRAGVVEARGVRMFERWLLADKLLGGPVAQTIDYRVNGVGRIFETSGDDGSEGQFCTQQMLVGNLLREHIDLSDGDVRFAVADVAIYNEQDCRPSVSYSDSTGPHEILCDYIVGCDGDRGVSRASIPDGVLSKFSHEFGYAWLAALVEAPVTGQPVMGVSDHGFVAQLPRGPGRSRYYLQCPLSDGPEDWPDERLWNEIRLRRCDSTIQNAVVHDKDFVPLRSAVYAPMQYRNLFLAGDAAHLVPPTGAKGMNLALFDVDVLAQALTSAVRHHDTIGLERYSDTVLPHIWKYQEFSVWMTETMHDAGDATQHGTFRQMIARARLDTLFDSSTAGRLHGEYQRGDI